jgi:hypothetical protein
VGFWKPPKKILFFFSPFLFHTYSMQLTPIQDNPLYIGCLFGLFFSFFSWSILDYLSKTRQRQRALESLAMEMGFRYFRSKWEFERSGLELPELLRPRRARKTLLGLGPAWGCQNILEGTKERRETFYLERLYPQPEGGTETVALYGQKGTDLPYFELVPLRLFDKFHRLLELDVSEMFRGPQMKRMEIIGLGDFRRPRHHLWGVAGQEERYKNFFSKDFLEYLLQFPSWRLKGQGDWVMILEENYSVPPEKMREFTYQTAQAAFMIFPKDVPSSAALGEKKAGLSWAPSPIRPNPFP